MNLRKREVSCHTMQQVVYITMNLLHVLVQVLFFTIATGEVSSVWADSSKTTTSTACRHVGTVDSRSHLLSYIPNPTYTTASNTATSNDCRRSNSNQRWHKQQEPHHERPSIQLSAVIGSSVPSNKYPKLTPLPLGLSPFDKSVSKTFDVQSSFRSIALTAIQRAISDPANTSGRHKIYEIEIPPLLSNGIDMSKNQFDDFDNVQELNGNRNWCLQLIPKLLSSPSMKTDVVWFILPDDKECEIAKKEYTEQLRYKSTSTIQFTSIRAAFAATSRTGGYKKAWGTSIAETMNKLQGGDGILADSSTLDELVVVDDATNASGNGKTIRGTRRIQLICQPGNGGPVEDWINVEQFCYNTIGKWNGGDDSNNAIDNNNNSATATIIVNGALDKVRDGYYPPIFFPALAKTIPFYQQQCEALLFVKPITDKGLYGWIFRVYPEPWQIVLQLPRRPPVTSSNKNDNDDTKIVVDDIVVLISNTRPSYQEAVNAMVREAKKRQSKT